MAVELLVRVICVNVLLYPLRVFVWGILSCHVAGGGVKGGAFSEDRAVESGLWCGVVLCVRKAETTAERRLQSLVTQFLCIGIGEKRTATNLE